MAGESRRELVMVALVASFAAVTATTPVDDPYPFAWSEVTRFDLSDRKKGKSYVLGIYDTGERKSREVGFKLATLRVVFEFSTHIPKGTNPSTHLNTVLLAIQRRLMEDPTLGGFAVDLEEISNETTVDGEFTGYGEGAVFVDIRYRHSARDPRELYSV